jgi:hypothetical protein
MTKNMYESMSRYIATWYLRFNDSTIQPFNVAQPFGIRHCTPILGRNL